LSIDGIIFLALVQLMGFHIYINHKGRTTYGHISLNREKKQKQAEVKSKKLSKQEYEEWLAQK
jgi:hypothetical protein